MLQCPQRCETVRRGRTEHEALSRCRSTNPPPDLPESLQTATFRPQEQLANYSVRPRAARRRKCNLIIAPAGRASPPGGPGSTHRGRTARRPRRRQRTAGRRSTPAAGAGCAGLVGGDVVATSAHCTAGHPARGDHVPFWNFVLKLHKVFFVLLEEVGHVRRSTTVQGIGRRRTRRERNQR